MAILRVVLENIEGNRQRQKQTEKDKYRESSQVKSSLEKKNSEQR